MAARGAEAARGEEESHPQAEGAAPARLPACCSGRWSGLLWRQPEAASPSNLILFGTAFQVPQQSMSFSVLQDTLGLPRLTCGISCC